MQEGLQAQEIPGLVEAALEITNARRKLLPPCGVEGLRAELGCPLAQAGAKGVIRIRAAGKANDIGALREPALFEVIVEAGMSLRQVRSPEAPKMTMLVDSQVSLIARPS